MVSYFLPQGRFLIRSLNLRQLSKQQAKWSIRSTSCRSITNDNSRVISSKVNGLIRDNSDLRKSSTVNTECADPAVISPPQKKSAWFTWTGFLLRWAPMGFCVFGAIEWQLHKNKLEKENLPRTASQFQSKVYCWLPLRILSRFWGWLAGCYLPHNFRPFIFGWYSNAFNVNIEEALHSDYKYYNSLADFFTRPLKDGVRLIDQKCQLVSPADGKVLHFGTASNSLIEQVKGVNYSIESFLGPPTWVNKQTETLSDYSNIIKEKTSESTALYQCVIYLAPGDYHRFHSPTQWQPTIRRHFTGELLSVSPKIATWLPGLFCINERVLYIGKWKHGFFSFTAVGATNVGSVQFYNDEKLKTNRWVGLNVGSHKKKTDYEELQLPNSTELAKGECVGQFNMGSTIVLIFEAPTDFKFHIKPGQTIKVGEPLGFVD